MNESLKILEEQINILCQNYHIFIGKSIKTLEFSYSIILCKDIVKDEVNIKRLNIKIKKIIQNILTLEDDIKKLQDTFKIY